MKERILRLYLALLIGLAGQAAFANDCGEQYHVNFTSYQDVTSAEQLIEDIGPSDRLLGVMVSSPSTGALMLTIWDSSAATALGTQVIYEGMLNGVKNDWPCVTITSSVKYSVVGGGAMGSVQMKFLRRER